MPLFRRFKLSLCKLDRPSRPLNRFRMPRGQFLSGSQTAALKDGAVDCHSDAAENDDPSSYPENGKEDSESVH